MFQVEVPMLSLILVTIGQILKKWQQFFEIQDGGIRHLEKYTSGEPPSREMNSWYITFNQKCNFF